jgi:D-alanyl-D-alanine dipeptidase
MKSSVLFCLLVGCLLFVSVKHKFLIFSNEANDKVVVNDTTFVNLKDYSDDFVYDMKYAEDNFLKAKSMIAQNFASENSRCFSRG